MVDENSSKALRWHYVHGKVFLGNTMRRFPRPHGHSFFHQETVDCRCISSGSLQSLVWDSQMKRVLHTSVYYIYWSAHPPPPPRQPKGEKNRSNLRDSVMPLLCRELDGGFNSVEKYYFPKVCCENQESSKPPTREKTTQRIYNSWFSQMLLLGICKCRFFSLENFLNFVLQEFLHVSIWPRRDGLLHLKNCLEHIKVPHCVQPLTQKTLQRFLVAMEAP